MSTYSVKWTAIWLLVLAAGASAMEAREREISPLLVGQNMWLPDSAEGRTGYIEQLWPEVGASGVKLVRIGGIEYNINMRSKETLVRWVRLIKSIGAEPMVQVSEFKEPGESAALVRFFNQDEKLRIQYWSIGNEAHHYHMKDVKWISENTRKHASAMKAVDPSIKIFAPDAAWYNEPLYLPLIGGELDITGKDENGHWFIDGVSFHSYPNASDYTREDVVLKSAGAIRGMITALSGRLEYANRKQDRKGDARLLWALTEFNITYSNPPELGTDGIAVPSFINGQFWSEVFGLGMEFGAFSIDPWCIQESDNPETYFGYLGTPPDFHPHSTYYHLQMIARHMGGTFVQTRDSDDFVKTIAARSKDGFAVMIMNQHLERDVDFELVLDGNAKDTNVLTIHADAGIKAKIRGTIPEQSTCLYLLDHKGRMIRRIDYGITHARKNQPPATVRSSDPKHRS